MPIYDNVDDLLLKVADVAEFALKGSFPGVPVILSHGGGEEPSEGYVSVYTLGVTPLTRRYTSTLVDEDEYVTIHCHYEIRVQYSFLGSKAFPMAMKFFHAIDSNTTVLECLALNKLGVLTKSDIRSIPQQRETDWVDRYVTDVAYSFALETKQKVLTVGAVRIIDPLTGQTIELTEPTP